jgi:hypothetical protein
MPAPTECLIVFGLDHRQRDVGLVEQRVVGAQHRALVAVGLVAAHHHAAGAQGVFAQDVLLHAPARTLQSGGDALVANVGFAQAGGVHSDP